MTDPSTSVERDMSAIPVQDGAGVGFTPGPWVITSVSLETGAVGIAKDRIMIAEVHNGYSFMDVVQGNHPAEQFANARLIAAAPSLYEALEWFVRKSDDIIADISLAHRSRGNGCTEWMREDDRDFRSDLKARFETARAALLSAREGV